MIPTDMMLLECVDALTIAAISAYALLSMAFICVMWCIRHNFFIAMRWVQDARQASASTVCRFGRTLQIDTSSLTHWDSVVITSMSFRPRVCALDYLSHEFLLASPTTLCAFRCMCHIECVAIAFVVSRDVHHSSRCRGFKTSASVTWESKIRQTNVELKRSSLAAPTSDSL